MSGTIIPATILDAASSSVEFALNWLLQSTVLIALGLFIVYLLRERGSAFRSAAYRTILIAVLICPLATCSLSRLGLTGWSVRLPKVTDTQTQIQTQSDDGAFGSSNASKLAAAQCTTSTNQTTDSERASAQFAISAANDSGQSNTESEAAAAAMSASAVPNSSLTTQSEVIGSRSRPSAVAEYYEPSRTVGMFAAVAVLVWLCISFSMGWRLVSAYLALNRLRRHAVRADVGTIELCREVALRLNVVAPEVYRTPFLLSPCLAGILRPTVLLPEVEQTSSLREILAHELAHLKRCDCHWKLLRQLANILFFFQPLMWVLSHRMELAAEEVCDDYVVSLGGNRREYAQSLVDIAQLSHAPLSLAGVGIVSFRSMLASRVSRIMDTSRSLSTSVNRLLLISVVTVGLLASTFAGLIGVGPRVSQAVAADAAGGNAGGGNAAGGSAEPEGEALQLSGRVVDHDGRPVARAIVEVATISDSGKLSVQAETDANGTFEASIAVKPVAAHSLRIQARNSEGSQVGYYRFSYDSRDRPKVDALEIKLSPAKNARIKVVDANGNPVAGAQVAIKLPFPHTFGGISTDETGLCTFSMPESERIEAVVAWKDQAGLDYRSYEFARGQQADVNAKQREFPADGTETLTLDGVAPLAVVLKDDQQPLDGVAVYPWLLKKDSEPQELNLSMFFDLFYARSDAGGKATFAWMPAWQKTLIQVWPVAPRFAHTRGTYDPSTGTGMLELQMDRLVPIRGRVTDPDGRPCEGIAVAASGAGYLMDRGQASTTTDEAGRYELLVPPNQLYLVVVKDDRWASAPQDGFVVLKDQAVEGKDFHLRKATRVFGQLVGEDNQHPIANENVLVYQYGRDLHSMKLALPNPDNSRIWVQPLQVFSAKTDEQGRFEFMLGDGKFDIRPPRQEKSEKFEIEGQTELEFRVSTKLNKELELVGNVALKADQSPVGAAILEGVSRAFSGRDWQATTTADGTFRIKRSPEPYFIHARSADKKLAGIAQIDSSTKSLSIELQPVGSVTGRLLTTDSQGPIAKAKITYGVRVPDENEQAWSYRFGGMVITDEDGSFRLSELVPDVEYTLSLETTPDGIIPTLSTCRVAPGESLDLKDLPAPAPRKPYVPPTLEDRIKSAFEVPGTPLKRLERASELVALVDQHLLIVFGLPEDRRIHRLMEIRFEDPDFRPLSDEFRFMAIPTGDDQRGPADALAEKLDVALDGDRDKFLVVILDHELKKVATADSSTLCIDGELSKERLLELLRKHLTKPLDARQLLESALKQATAENKRVIVQETATWCGPCHMLAAFLDQHRVWEKDYVWVKMDHRWTGAVELMAELRDGAEGGIPWFAILDSSGKTLSTSNDPTDKHNIGFPSEPKGQTHFFNMLNTTRQRLSEQDIKSFVERLTQPSQE